jgi:peptidyl-prolyl cis-trans isomerase SurA
MKSKLMIGFGLAACSVALAAKDSIVMTVNGVDVTKSEFEYLYHKNSQQQIEAQPLDQYAEMFKIYKLKVADAIAEGIDTLPSFKKEMQQYRHELALPYLTDSTYLNKLVDEAYERAGEEVETSHIMFFKKRSGGKCENPKAKLDSIKNEIAKGADFATLAAEYSEDRGSSSRGGSLGYITISKFPYSFEKAAFSLKEGEVSDIVESPVGYHLIKSGKHRPSRGKVLTGHVMLRLDQNADEATVAAQKAKADSIYEVLKNDPSKFTEIATNLSDDKGSARQGGMLPWFGAGEMVEEFDSAAFALNNGEISTPVRSRFGWHIIKKFDSRPLASKEEMKPELLSRINNTQDERYTMVRHNETARLEKKNNGKLNDKNIATIRTAIMQAGLDSVFYTRIDNGELGSLPVFSIAKQDVPASELFAQFRRPQNAIDVESSLERFDQSLDRYYNRKLVEYEESQLEKTVPEYRNLLNEYRDGSLLYEVSTRKVWDKASKDNEGLEAYFNEHRDDYNWKLPHVKGYLVQAVNDSVANSIRCRMESLEEPDMLKTARKEFKNEAQIDRILVEKGSNAMVDNIMFGGPGVQPSSAKYSTYFLFQPKIIGAPEEVSDVRGQVTGDYQNQLEADWIQDLKAKYPVKVNEKELKKVK